VVCNTEKTCTGCGEAKPLSEFYRHPNTRDGRQSRCRACWNTKAPWKRICAVCFKGYFCGGRGRAPSTCSVECAAALAKRKRLDAYDARARAAEYRAENPLRAKTCPVCREEFTPRHMNQKLCSQRCVSRDTQARRVFGISGAEYVALLEAAEECAGCGEPFAGRRKVLDHCHKTGRVRGVLCNRCNVRLGHLEADPELARRLLEYAAR
jgi:hypothetical protein